MTRVRGWLYKRVLAIRPEEATFSRRGFRGRDLESRKRLEWIGRTFIRGYRTALEEAETETLGNRLEGIDAEFRGFAFEGAAMALAHLDYLAPWKRDRLSALLAGPGASHAYMVHVGAGWAQARLRRPIEPPRSLPETLLRWLAVDGYGFHEGYFHGRRYVGQRHIPRGLGGYALRVFDQGLGRSLWFVEGADVAQLPVTIAAFPPSRQADLWSGVGLACAYAGGVESAAIQSLKERAGPYRPHLAQGAAFAAKARQRAGNPSRSTEIACEVLCARSADEAAGMTDSALVDLAPDGPDPAYEVWRKRIQHHFRFSPEPVTGTAGRPLPGPRIDVGPIALES